MSNKFTRRDFLRMSAAGVGAVVVSSGLAGCNSSDSSAGIESGGDSGGSQGEVSLDKRKASFNHGVASGDPLSDRVILWTRVTPLLLDGETVETIAEFAVSWEVAEDSGFKNVIRTGSTNTSYASDFTVKVDAVGLDAGVDYYFRFIYNGVVSAAAKTRTLPEGDVAQARFAVVSCANYHCGYFNVYKEIAKEDGLDAVLHLGDYIYEYGDEHSNVALFESKSGGAQRLTGIGPKGGCITLADYRSRYALHHLEPELQEAHHKVPFITVWDDHELANDVYMDGAEAHNPDIHGPWEPRRAAALQTYFEWMPIRPASFGDNETITRQFKYGNLVDLMMLDTRIAGREVPPDMFNYIDFSNGTLDKDNYLQDVAQERGMLGAEQFHWLSTKLYESTAKWQVIGQQVPMARLEMPTTPFMMCFGGAGAHTPAMIDGLIDIKNRMAAGDPTVSDAQKAQVADVIPFRSTAWDGYNSERNMLLQNAKYHGANLIVLAGDTHNFWANRLTLDNGESVGVEFAIGSISSFGHETYFKLEDADAAEIGPRLGAFADDVEYFNLYRRGFMLLSFTQAETTAEFKYIDTAFSRDYNKVAGPVFKVDASDCTKVITVSDPNRL
ncbi:alkaline phosphatase D family protein [Psychromonas ossibalaenae]|uniref:alkaline phosphatase D family protein n=1 Tax=Psychromonas ossibalaenae TaxID=444922 RepID=UPI0003671A71|nr:alkaline phosphatase D family protein [Psychromonas ossibalaenae]